MGTNKKPKKKHHDARQPGMSYAQTLARQALIRQAVEKSANDATVQLQSDIQTQKAMWLMVVSIADAFGIGSERMKRDFFPVLQRNTDELERMMKDVDEEYAYEKLRRRAELVAGIPIEYLYEHEIAEAKAAHEKLWPTKNEELK